MHLPEIATLRGHITADDSPLIQARPFELPSRWRGIPIDIRPANLKCGVCSGEPTVEINCRVSFNAPDDWTPSCDRHALPHIACREAGCRGSAYVGQYAYPDVIEPVCDFHVDDHYRKFSIVPAWYGRTNAWLAA